jgi:hypothetical protein
MEYVNRVKNGLTRPGTVQNRQTYSGLIVEPVEQTGLRTHIDNASVRAGKEFAGG